METAIENSSDTGTGVLASVLSIVTLLLGALGAFGQLQDALNTIWEVKPKPGLGIKGFLRARLFSFTMVLSVAFLLLVSLVLSAGLSAVGAFFEHKLPGGAALWSALNFIISFGVITGLFALIFKTVPDVQIAWRDVWPGAALTALLFTIGKLALGLYLGRASVASPFGAAGSIIVLVIWVYYATQILFMGAEFTQVYARSRGAKLTPSKHAVPAEKPAHTSSEARTA
jgi:membrane protein